MVVANQIVKEMFRKCIFLKKDKNVRRQKTSKSKIIDVIRIRMHTKPNV